MKKFLFLTMFLFLMPCVVFAETYHIGEFYTRPSGEFTQPSVANIFEPGDVIDFTGATMRAYIYIDDQEVDGCYGNLYDCVSSYTVPQNVIYLGSLGESYQDLSLYFKTIDDNTNIYLSENLQDGHIYRSGDFIVLPHGEFQRYYYDYSGIMISRSNFGIFVENLPEYYDTETDSYKPVMWLLTIEDDGVYAPYTLVFNLYNYIEPKFRLSCDKNEINYGEKTKCSLSVMAIQQLKDVSFNLELPNFIISNVQNDTHVSSFDGDLAYNLRVEEGYAVAGNEVVIMTFDLEAAKNAAYVDDVTLTDIFYRDTVYDGAYTNLQNNISIKPVGNPKTAKNIALLLLPIFLMFSGLLVHHVSNKKN